MTVLNNWLLVKSSTKLLKFAFCRSSFILLTHRMSSDNKKSDKDKKEPVPEQSEKPESEDSASGSSTSADSLSTAGLNVEAIRKYLAQKLGFYDDDGEQKEKVKVLDDVSIEGIANFIKSDKCKKIITLAGAGISTSAGIPDFRSPGSGLYHNLKKYNLPHPQAIFELDFFHDNPKPFFELAKELYPGTFKPTKAHYFIKLLSEKGLLLRHYTQNIDTLEHVAGIPSDRIVEAHGTFHLGHCLHCRKEYSQEWMKEKIFKDLVPICEDCPGVVKPDIVFFGENLPEKFHNNMLTDFPQCDVLIILGSSLVVQPFAALIDRVSDECPRLLINREKAGHRTGFMAMLGMSGGMDFDSPDNTRDVAWLGDCDEGCQVLADLLGWGDELKEICKKAHEEIDKKNAKDQKCEKSSDNTEASEVKDEQKA